MTMLVSLIDMKAYVNELTITYDQFLTDQITIISDAIEGYCGRKLLTASYTQTYEAQDYSAYERKQLYLFHYPVTAITTVKEIEILPTGNNETTLTAPETLLHGESGKIKRKSTSNVYMNWFTEYGHASQVEVVYDAGFATTPTPIEDVVFNLVSERYNKKINGIEVDFGNNVQRMAIPGVMSIDFDYTLQANERKSSYGMILGNYLNVIDTYRSERGAVKLVKENYVT